MTTARAACASERAAASAAGSTPSASSMRSGIAWSAARSRLRPPIERTRSATAASCAVYVFVAATLRSTPAWSGSTQSAARASGLDASFTIASVGAPARRAAATVSTTSGERPDCEMPITRAPFTRGGAAVERHEGRSRERDGQPEDDPERVLRVARRVVGRPARGHEDPRRVGLPQPRRESGDPPPLAAENACDGVGLLADLGPQDGARGAGHRARIARRHGVVRTRAQEEAAPDAAISQARPAPDGVPRPPARL